jgi:hypothetical protein
MEYNHESVTKIVTQYSLLKESLEKLRDAKRTREGVILGYAASEYLNVMQALEFLHEIPNELKENLKINELEKEALDFANAHIRL